MSVQYKANGLPKYCYRDVTQHGTPRVRFVRQGVTATLRSSPRTKAFELEYLALLQGERPASQKRRLYGKNSINRPTRSVNLGSQVLKGCKRRASNKGLEYTIDRYWVLDQLDRQGYKCALSGKRFDLAVRDGSRRPWFPSIDRVDNRKGYSPENCRLVATIVNLARQDWKDADFEEMCKLVHQRNIS